MAKRSKEDTDRLAAIYRGYANDSNVDVNDADNIIIALDKKVDYFRDKIMNAEEIIRELRLRLEAVQDNTTTEIIKALSENGFDTITINAYKSKEE